MDKIEESELGYRINLILYLGLSFVLFVCALSFNFRHTYELPLSAPGVLVSDRWSFEFMRELLMWLYMLIFISGPFMRQSRTKNGVAVHLVVLVLLTLLAILNGVADGFTLWRANLTPGAPNFTLANLARDPRWCCKYGLLPGTELICAIINPCPAVPTLYYNPVFVTRVIVNILFGVFFIYDFWVTLLVYVPVLNEYLKKYNNKKI